MALLCMKVECPEIEQFIKEHSSDAAAFWCDAKEQRKAGTREWETEKHLRNDLEGLNDLGLQTNSWIPFLKAAVMKMNAMLFTTLVTPRQNQRRMKNPVKHLRCSFLQKQLTAQILVFQQDSEYVSENAATEYVFSSNSQAFLCYYYLTSLHMFISCVNRLMLGGINRSYALKQNCKFYLQVFIQVSMTTRKHQWVKYEEIFLLGCFNVVIF